MKKSLLMISYMLIFITCTSSVDKQKYMEERLKKVNVEYQQDIKESQIPMNLLDHFPHNIKYMPVSREKSYATSNKRISYMLFEYNVPRVILDSISNHYTKAAIQISSGNASNLYIVKSALQIELYGETSLCKEGIIKSYPIPFFESKEFNSPEDVVTKEDMYSKSNKSGLSDNFRIYVLGSESGNFREGLEPLEYMPKEWKNGYSRGVCLNKKLGVIIYWVIIW